MYAIPLVFLVMYTEAKYKLSFAFVDSSISIVPGVIILITSLFTMPLASFGSSICSQIATLNPFATSLAIYEFAA